jgi:PAS domain S-box-containing protein
MDSMSINDLVFECIRALVLLALLATLFLRGSFTSLAKHPGWKSILTGFSLITAATLLDITDEIPGLEKYIIIGETIYQAFLEKVPGYLLGFILVLIGFYRMIPSLLSAEEHEKSLNESEERFRQIFAANPDPVILARFSDGAILDVSPSFEQQTGYLKHEVLNKNSADLDLWENPEMRQNFRDRLKAFGSVDNLEAEFLVKHRANRPGMLSARLVELAGEMCILIVIRDITSIKKAEKALMEVDQIRADFISTAAHELRTPLSVLIGYADLLSTNDVDQQFSPEKKQEFLEEIKQKGLVLSQIIDDLLDISKMYTGNKFDFEFETLDPNDLLTKAFEQCHLHASGHRFRIDLSQSREIQIECDRQRLLQVLENLLSNSIKYSKPGSLITLSGCSHAESYSFSVSDEGIGMNEEQVAKIYDKFYRADASNTAVGGLGLGMSIVKQIVDAMSGTITIDSTPDQGTRITVTLPYRQTA